MGVRRVPRQRIYLPQEFVGIRKELAEGLQIFTYGRAFEDSYTAAPNLGLGPALITVGAGALERRDGRLGPMLGRGSASGSQVYQLPTTALNTLLAATGEATCLAVMRSAAGDGSGGKGPISLANGGAAEHYPFTDGLIYIGSFAGNRWVNGVTSPVAITAPHAAVMSHKSGSQTFHIAGSLLATDTRAETPSIGTDGTGPIGQNGAIYALLIWNRFLALKLKERLSADPSYAFAPRSIWVPVSSGGAASPVAANATYYQMIAQQRIGY